MPLLFLLVLVVLALVVPEGAGPTALVSLVVGVFLGAIMTIKD